MKVLIIEDEEVLAKVLKEEFTNEHFEVALVMNGDEALARIKSFHPDIILLDLILPKKDGLEILQELKADTWLSGIPVIIISNLGDTEHIKNGLALGAAAYLVKSQHSLSEIVAIVRQQLMKEKKPTNF
ncbi:MAG: response regulator [Patescibacteria group bacterium]|nr:response regulator [Patescibacteria group bacterium]MDE2437922.1 response regulator [Patescibacteria group bacterium]